MRLLLVRHGQTPANVSGSLDTLVPGPRLTALGRRQAAELRTTLAAERIDALYVSRLVRTHDTAAPLAAVRGLTAVPLAGLDEIAAGDLQQRTDHESALLYRGATQAWLQGRLDERMPGAESGHAFLTRFDTAVDQIVERHPSDATVTIVGHGGAIRVWAGSRARNVTAEFAMAHHLPNTGIVVLEGEADGAWRALTWNGQEVPGYDS